VINKGSPPLPSPSLAGRSRTTEGGWTHELVLKTAAAAAAPKPALGGVTPLSLLALRPFRRCSPQRLCLSMVKNWRKIWRFCIECIGPLQHAQDGVRGFWAETSYTAGCIHDNSLTHHFSLPSGPSTTNRTNILFSPAPVFHLSRPKPHNNLPLPPPPQAFLSKRNDAYGQQKKRGAEQNGAVPERPLGISLSMVSSVQTPFLMVTELPADVSHREMADAFR